MDSDIKLSTQFLTTQNAHQVGMLVTLHGKVDYLKKISRSRKKKDSK